MKKKKSSATSLMSNILGGVELKKDGVRESSKTNSVTAFSHIEKKSNKKTTQMVTTMWVSPEKCRIQERPNRFYDLLTPERCASLISSIEGQGQKIPVVARQTGELDKPYEIVVGRRRHFVATYLKIDLLIDVRVLSDEEAFLLSDAENDGREDLSDLEKAYDWADALENLYNNNVARLAAALNKTRPTVYEYLALAKLDKEIICAFDSPLDVKKGHAAKFVSLLKDPNAKKRLFDMAAELSKKKGLSGAQVFKMLVSASKSPVKKGGLLVNEDIKSRTGKIVFNLTKNRRGGTVIKINNTHDADKAELIKLITKAINKFE
mgnify:CR=1 FL=1